MKPEELLDVVGDYDALVVRSETKVTAEVIAKGVQLQVIARAGIGVDNIDLDAATALASPWSTRRRGTPSRRRSIPWR